MQEEVDGQLADGNYLIVLHSKVPTGRSGLPDVWVMQWKRDWRTGRVRKWKAGLNQDGSKMKHGIYYNEKYAPVAAWSSVRLILAMAAMFNWKTVQLDYIKVNTQAPVE